VRTTTSEARRRDQLYQAKRLQKNFRDQSRFKPPRDHRRERTIVCPLGLAIKVQLGTYRDRFYAFALDGLIGFFSALFLTFIMFKIFSFRDSLASSLISFLWYFYLNFYFLYFELAWRGRTPGKKIFNLRVINRRGGELTPAMVIARNLTRQVEIFFPLIFFFQSIGSSQTHFFWYLLDFVFIVVMFCLPIMTRDTLRLGDLVGGSLVIETPKAVLLADLATLNKAAPAYVFSEKQLGFYGDLELKTLESALRLANSEPNLTLTKIAKAIAKKINYETSIPPTETIRFLNDFYKAERGWLERGRLFGRRKDSQKSPTRGPDQPQTPNLK
jgi:uncharacterized RDD family membrane protein YckC